MRRLFYATQAVSEYSPQISLLELCMRHVIARIKFQGRDTPGPVPPSLIRTKPCTYVDMHKYLYMNKSLHKCLCHAVGAKLNHIPYVL